MNTAIYLRKSRADEQDESIDDTLRRHKETLLEFAANQPSMVITEIYEEVVSGDKLYLRPQMLKLLSDAEQGLFDAVLVKDMERLGRGSASEQGLILETFKRNDIKIITPREVLDLNNERDEDYAEFRSFFARQELKTIKRRLRDGTIKSVKEGCHLWEAPYGYKRAVVNKSPTVEIFEEEAKFVRMIFDLYVNSGLGSQAIAHTINAMGAKPHKSDKFNRTSVVAILRNKTYIGKIVFNKKSRVLKNGKMTTVYHSPEKWIIVDGKHPPIIDDATFEKAQEILSGRYHKPFYDGTINNPLAGILKCAKCGYGMQRRPYPAERKYQSTTLLCATKGCCTSSRLDLVEKKVIQNVEEKLEELKVQIKNKKSVYNFEPIIDGIKKELSTLSQQKANLHDLLERGVYDIDTYVERSNVIANRTATLEKELQDTLNKQHHQTTSSLNKTIKTFENVLKLYWDSAPPERNKLLKQIIATGTYYKEKGWKPNQFLITLNFRNV